MNTFWKLAGAVLALALTAACGGNPVIENIMSRRSVRHYTYQTVPRDLLQKIAECGINAPNAMNKQEWEVRIIDNPDYFDEVTKVMKEEMPGFVKEDEPGFRNAFRNATAAIAVACPDDESGMTLINVGLGYPDEEPDAKPRDKSKIRFID